MFALDIRKNLKIGKIKFTGFHIDSECTLEKLGIFKYANKVVHPKYGVIKGNLLIDSVLKPGHTVFPPTWSEEKVIDVVLESLDNIFEILPQRHDRFQILGKTKQGLEIKSIISKDFFNAYPNIEIF